MSEKWMNGVPPWRQPVTDEDVRAGHLLLVFGEEASSAIVDRANTILAGGTKKPEAIRRACSEHLERVAAGERVEMCPP